MVISSRMAGDESPLTSTSPRYPSPLHFAKTAIAPANCHVAPSRVSARHHPNLPVLLRGIWKKALFKCKVQNFSHGFHLPYAIAQYRADDLLKVNPDGSRKLTPDAIQNLEVAKRLRDQKRNGDSLGTCASTARFHGCNLQKRSRFPFITAAVPQHLRRRELGTQCWVSF